MKIVDFFNNIFHFFHKFSMTTGHARARPLLSIRDTLNGSTPYRCSFSRVSRIYTKILPGRSLYGGRGGSPYGLWRQALGRGCQLESAWYQPAASLPAKYVTHTPLYSLFPRRLYSSGRPRPTSLLTPHSPLFLPPLDYRAKLMDFYGNSFDGDE
jgi:hypothetical protein